MNYQEITNYFGRPLIDQEFADFLTSKFSDLSEYDIYSSYMVAEDAGLEFGFVNETAVFDDDTLEVFDPGNPVFSHLNILPACKILTALPFDIDLAEFRSDTLKKTGEPYQTIRTQLTALSDLVFIDHFKTENHFISIDYDPETERIRNIQIRDLKLLPDKDTLD